MFYLTSRQRFIVVAIVLAMLVGVAVKHWRDGRRAAIVKPAAILAEP